MTTPLLTRKALIGGAYESISGTAETVSAAFTNSVFYNPQFVLVDPFNAGERKPIGNYLGNVPSTRGKLMARATFQQELRDGDALSVLLQGAGATVATGGVHTPTSVAASRKTVTLACWEDGRKKIMKGCVGNGTLNYNVGERLLIDWEFVGVPVLATGNVWPIAASMPSWPSMISQPYRAASGTLTLASFSPVFNRFSLAFGNVTTMREDVTAATGYSHGWITERTPTITLDPEATLPADHNAYALMLSGTTFALSATATDGTNTITIAGAAAQRTAITHGDREGRLTDDITCLLTASSGDDEWTITQP
jgi:hypothetical protein